MKYTPGYLNLLPQHELNSLLGQAAFNNDLEIMKYLLTSSELNQHAEINSNYNILACICANGDLETLRYVLTSPDLKEHANIHLDDEQALNSAIGAGHISIVKYLLTSSELKEHSNLYFKYKKCFLAFENIFEVNDFTDKVKLLDYFTLDYAVEKKDVNLFLKLTEYADDIDLEEQITINLCNIIEKEQDKSHQSELKKTLKKLDIDKYNMVNAYLLQKELKGELPENKQNKSKKMKV
jgi:hypothetical protein